MGENTEIQEISVKLTFEYWAEYFLSWLVPTLAIASSSGSALPCATMPRLSVFFLFFFSFFSVVRVRGRQKKTLSLSFNFTVDCHRSQMTSLTSPKDFDRGSAIAFRTHLTILISLAASRDKSSRKRSGTGTRLHKQTDGSLIR